MKTLRDIEAMPDQERLELIDGQIVPKAQPGGEHSHAFVSVLRQLIEPFLRPFQPDDTGGWWILPEVSVYYPNMDRVLIPDIAGWRRALHPERPKGYPVKVRPDWVCEISHTTWQKDTTTVLETLQVEGVPHYWLLDVERRNLIVFELKDGKYIAAQNLFADNGRARIRPFDAVELEVAALFGDDS
jgi:Uma2 family endonuclease